MCRREVAKITLELVNAFTSHCTADRLNFFLFQERHCHFQRGVYNAWKQGQPRVIERSREPIPLLSVSWEAGRGHACTWALSHLCPSPASEQSSAEAVQLIQTCSHWTEGRPVCLGRGILYLPFSHRGFLNLTSHEDSKRICGEWLNHYSIMRTTYNLCYIFIHWRKMWAFEVPVGPPQ